MPDLYKKNLKSCKQQIGLSSTTKINFIVNAAKWQTNLKYEENWNKFGNINSSNLNNGYILKLNKFSESTKKM